MLQCASTIAPFDFNTECQSHTACCVGIMFWKTYCMIESRLNITMKGRKTTLLQKGTLHVWRTPLYFVGIRFLERSNALPWRKIAAHKWKVYVEMKTFARAALCLIDECIIMCMGASRVAFEAVSKWFCLLGCSNLSILFPLHRLFVNFTDFFLAGGIFFGRKLGKDFRHDDVYEEFAPTTHCKTSTKKHSHSSPLSSF